MFSTLSETGRIINRVSYNKTFEFFLEKERINFDVLLHQDADFKTVWPLQTERE